MLLLVAQSAGGGREGQYWVQTHMKVVVVGLAQDAWGMGNCGWAAE